MKIDHSSQVTRRAARMRPSCFAALLPRLVCAALLILFFALIALPQSKYEKRRIAKVDITLGDTDKDQRAIEQYRLIVRVLLNGTYSIPRIRDAITALYETKQIDTVSVSAALDTAGDVELLFTIKRKTQAGKVSVVVGPSIGDPVTESDLLYKLNLITPGAILTEQILQNNADEILSYLRERGYYQSQVTYERRPLEYGNEVGVTFRVTPATQARVGELTFRIEGYNKPIPPQALRLRKGELYSRERRLSDFAKIRELLREDDFLAPELEDPDVIYDGDTNTISVEFAGKAGPVVKVIVESEENKVGSDTQMRILPVKREGTLDYSAIVEGERRLENYFQEKGYFFANVTPVCSADPPLIDAENNTLANGSESLCNVLGGEDLKGRSIEIKYLVDPNRRLTLQRLRLRGTDKMTIEDVKAVLSSQEANILGIIPIFGYGRGYTSQSILETDAETVRTLMAELGYRDASVRVTQGVSPNGEDLIITFVVDDGVPSIVKQVSFVGNRVLDSNQLRAVIPNLEGQSYSRAKERNAVQKLRETYSDLGYYDARVTSKVYGLEGEPAADRRDVRIEFKVDSEGRKVVINRILVRGVDNTKTEAVLRALTLRPGELLRTADIYSSEQNLYSTDAFSRIEIKPQPAGDDPNGNRLTDIIVSLEEQPPRLMSYGGGFSTDLGLSGFFDLRHVNLFGSLWQGGTRVKMSQRQQLVQFDFINPRFIRDGDKKWAPLTLTALYQRDTTVTRFFRSAFDKGTFGIVQRVDEDGNPIDEFGNAAGDPTINRAAFSAETSRTISRKDRSILFVRYKFEDVRLYDIESLLIADLLRPDRYTRLSGFGATFVRDTRKNCSPKYTLLDLIAKGEPSDPCRYSAGDPTKGQYLTADYSVSVPALGANIGFHKFQATYNYFYTIPKLKNTTLAARGILGLASVFSGGDRYTDSDYPWLNGLLPISERFFAGGSNSIRGFDFEEAGPRVVIVPEGSFIDSNGDPIFLDPFTVPFGGNGLAVVNLEARIPVSRSLRLVPFYDGGNVYKNAGDIFKRPSVSPSDLNRYNQRGIWTHTVGVGLRVKTPLGGDFGVDYGHQLNPPTFLIPQSVGPPAVYRLKQGQLHFRFSQAF